MIPKRHVVRRGFHLERWRIVTYLRWYYGVGQPRFEFEFRFGRPKPIKPYDDWITYEDDLAD